MKKTLLRFGTRLGGALVLILILAWLADLGFHALRLIQTYRKVQPVLAAESSPSQALNPAGIAAWIHTASGDLTALQRDLAPLYPLGRLAGPLPAIGGYGQQLEPALVYTSSLAQAADHLAQVLGPVIGQDRSQEDLTETALQAIQAGHDQIQEAALHLEEAAQARQKLDPEVLPAQFQRLVDRVDPQFPLLQEGVALLGLLPELLGAGQPQTYLILVQNHDELRATGGFISGIGTAVVVNGELVRLDLGDSYRVDNLAPSSPPPGYPRPPGPLERFMLAGYWLPRDANWSPDFPTSAQQAAKLVALSTGEAVDGVVAFDQAALVAVLEALGPVEAEGFPEPVSAANAESLIQAAWAPDPGGALDADWWEGRKDFMALLGKAILEKAAHMEDSSRLVKLAGNLRWAVETGHLQVYFTQPRAQAALSSLGWDGGLPSPDGHSNGLPHGQDFLLLVDSNLGFNKMDAVVERRLTYRVDLSALEAPRASITIEYQNPAPSDIPCRHEASYGSGVYASMEQRCYWDYWRLYLPEGARILGGQGPAVKHEWLLGGQTPEVLAGSVEILPVEQHLQPFGGMLVVPGGARAAVTLDVALPQGLLHSEANGRLVYHLTVQKQAGLDTLPVEVRVLPPVNTQCVDVPAGFQETEEGALLGSFSLTRAQEFTFSFAPVP